MVFFSTCACVEYFGIILGRLLKGLVDVTAIHGKKAKRDKVFDSFRKKTESGKRQVIFKISCLAIDQSACHQLQAF